MGVRLRNCALSFSVLFLGRNQKMERFVHNYVVHGVGLVNMDASLDGRVPSTVMKG